MDTRPSGLERAAKLLFVVGALGEIGVGALALAVPQVLGLLIDQPLDIGGQTAVRILGFAVLALGLSWWLARDRPERRALIDPGFVVYNLGAGAVFVWAAVIAARPLLPWLLAAVHVVNGVAVGLAMRGRGTPAR